MRNDCNLLWQIEFPTRLEKKQERHQADIRNANVAGAPAAVARTLPHSEM